MIKYIFQTLEKNILANIVRPFWPPWKLWDFTTVIMVWLNLPAKIRTELFFTGQYSRTILAKKILGSLQILQWPVWSDQSGKCKIHLNWQREPVVMQMRNYIAAIMLQNKDNRPLDYLQMTQLSTTLPKTIRASKTTKWNLKCGKMLGTWNAILQNANKSNSHINFNLLTRHSTYMTQWYQKQSKSNIWEWPLTPKQTGMLISTTLHPGEAIS